MTDTYTPIRWQDVKGLPEGARVQNDKKAKLTTVFLPYYFRNKKGVATSERDYIGTVKDGEFVPNFYYLHVQPTKKNRPIDRWKDPDQRKKAEAEAKASEQELESTNWHGLELKADEDITRQIGATALCAKILYNDFLVEDVARTLNYSLADTMNALNLGMFIALTSKASYLALPESEVCKFFGSGCLSSQRISDFLGRIGSTLTLSTRLSKHRMQRMANDGDLISVDGTFLDSNSKNIAEAAVGKRKDGSYGPQINYAMVSNASTGMPLGYRWYSGDTQDVTTLDDLKELWLDYGINEKKVEFVWDRGYFDSARMAGFDTAGFKFISGAKVGLKIVKNVIEQRNSEFYSANSQLQHHYCFGISEKVDIADRQANAYVYFSPNKQMLETRELREELKKAQKKWLDGKLKDNDRILDFFKNPVKGEPLVVDEDFFEQECYVRGFFACISNTDQTPDAVLDKYRTRNEVEVLFRLMIGRLLDTTRVHSTPVLEGLLFVVFIALSILSRLRKLLKNKVPARKNVQAAHSDIIDFDRTFTLDDYVTITEALSELRGVTVTVSKRTGKARFANLTDKKRLLLKDLGFEGLLSSADDAWDLLSAKHMDEVIVALKEGDAKTATKS